VVSGTGNLQFGPRLVIPVLPYLALGLIPFWMRGPVRVSTAWARLAFVLLLVPSIAICTLGAMGSTMYRDIRRLHAAHVYFQSLWPPVPEGMPVYNLAFYEFPLRHALVWVSLGMGLVAAWRLRALRHEEAR
jgi:hypothetical protein